MEYLKGFVAAFRFLTIIPLPTSFGCQEDDLAFAAVFFPVIGVFLGLVAGGAAWLFWFIFPPFVASVLLVLLLLSFSGGLHLDGLADTADGFFSARDRAATLVIMRDSRIGVMGVAAVIVIILLKVVCLGSISRIDAVHAALLMPVAGRCGLVVMMFLLPYVRPEGGLGTHFFSGNNTWPALVGIIILLIMGLLVNAMAGLVIALVAIGSMLLFIFYCRRKVGGATGDTLGAICEIAEAVIAFSVMSLFWR